MTTNSLYTIGGCTLRLTGPALEEAVSAIPGFQPFRSKSQFPELFRIQYVYGQEIPASVEKLYDFNHGGIHTTFFTTENGYALHMQQEQGQELHLWCDTDRKVFNLQGDLLPILLRFAIWIAYGLATVKYGRLALHSSCIVNHGKAYIFLGESGTGKSTHTHLWRVHIPGSQLLNDDCPILSVEADGIWMYGSPWSGKTPCYRAERYRLGGCIRLSQAPQNHMERLNVFKAFAALHPSCPPQFVRNELLSNEICKSLNTILSKIPVYHLACLPDTAAAHLSYQTLCGPFSL